ncbi:hypothetical protein [Psychroflexus aurantiacus]|nr:hypothetical protein [Psychroflexus aurantiacus]
MKNLTLSKNIRLLIASNWKRLLIEAEESFSVRMTNYIAELY